MIRCMNTTHTNKQTHTYTIHTCVSSVLREKKNENNRRRIDQKLNKHKHKTLRQYLCECKSIIHTRRTQTSAFDAYVISIKTKTQLNTIPCIDTEIALVVIRRRRTQKVAQPCYIRLSVYRTDSPTFLSLATLSLSRSSDLPLFLQLLKCTFN